MKLLKLQAQNHLDLHHIILDQALEGHCIPIDPFYLTWKAKEIGMNTRFIELAGEINTLMPGYVVSSIADALNKNGKQ